MSDWVGIVYRGFWDVPRYVIARNGQETFLFSSHFDDELDDYIDHYEVRRMPTLSDEDLRRSWVGLEERALERLPDIGLRELPFQVIARNSTDMDVLLRTEGK